MNDDRFDVVIWERATRVVDTIAGENMPFNHDYAQSAESRLATVLPRLNEHYTASIEPASRYRVGDVIRPVPK